MDPDSLEESLAGMSISIGGDDGIVDSDDVNKTPC